MKDKIFIAWNGDKTVARNVKRILESYDYHCYIGGNDQNDSKNASVGDTVITQLKECNQAIIIFQNVKREDGLKISQNVFFELGFAFALYGSAKVHCVKKNSERIELPTDFDNAFVEGLNDDSLEHFAEEIVKYFLNRQKMTLTINKFELINNRHLIHETLKKHYSDEGSKCSDYELAQYVLFYLLASQMFHDADKILDELEKFYAQHFSMLSTELSLALEFAIAMLRMVISVANTNGEIHISYDTYSTFEDTCKHILSLAHEDDVGDFYKWINMFIYEGWNYACILISKNPDEIDSDEKVEYLSLAAKTAEKTLKCIDCLKNTEICKKNHDKSGVLSLISSYISRNQFIVYSDSEYISKSRIDSSNKQYSYAYWLNEAKNLRFDMMNSFKGVLDTKLYNHFRIEYYLTVCEYLSYLGNDLNPTEIKKYKYGISRFLNEIRQQQKADNVYIDKIDSLFSSVC